MPHYYQLKCNICSFSIATGVPNTTYVTSEAGERIQCPHIGENRFIAKFLHIDPEDAWAARYHSQTGENAVIPEFLNREQEKAQVVRYCAPQWWLTWWTKRKQERFKAVRKLISSRTGELTDCICEQCHQFTLDYGKDRHICPVCSSSEVKRVIDLAGNKCPICGEEAVGKIDTGIVT